jgi:hypothetical protein
VATAYLTISPVAVDESSGSAARRPVMVRRARECAGEELKDRAVRAGTAARERRVERIACIIYGRFDLEMVGLDVTRAQIDNPGFSLRSG